jgi:predicted transcriptional regulator
MTETPSRTAQAIAWMVAHPGCSQMEAGAKFGISQAAVAIGLRRRREHHPERTEPVDARRHPKHRQRSSKT